MSVLSYRVVHYKLSVGLYCLYRPRAYSCLLCVRSQPTTRGSGLDHIVHTTMPAFHGGMGSYSIMDLSPQYYSWWWGVHGCRTNYGVLGLFCAHCLG